MTVIVAVRTGSATIIAADSMLTTRAPAGINSDGSPRWLSQSYAHAVKLAQDRTGTAIAAFSGHGTIGDYGAADWFSRLSLNLHVEPDAQDTVLGQLVAEVTAIRTAIWGEVPPEHWPVTSMILAAPPVNAPAPRTWIVHFVEQRGEVHEILKNPGVFVDGSTGELMTLLYGCSEAIKQDLSARLNLAVDDLQEHLNKASHLRPIRQINFWSMPLQDAIDFALFCANVQVQMDRFLPGLKNCGGPIDIMLLEMAPVPRIRSFPGKTLHA